MTKPRLEFDEVWVSCERVSTKSTVVIKLSVRGWTTDLGVGLAEMSRLGVCLDLSWRCYKLYFLTGREAGNQLTFTW